eukprot:gnl/Dysnectes_brevis/404_a446_2563.p1 GENE.gnl/Dysnectes_brevis/404_a446_2563~~gnl/Dysnectes_brevis/404_a446_2563.p1  ORF type:complete len:784 (-),score=337.84 gnl/Dysnectes_brevis/404_a446_2563:78-2402(-)
MTEEVETGEIVAVEATPVVVEAEEINVVEAPVDLTLTIHMPDESRITVRLTSASTVDDLLLRIGEKIDLHHISLFELQFKKDIWNWMFREDTLNSYNIVDGTPIRVVVRDVRIPQSILDMAVSYVPPQSIADIESEEAWDGEPRDITEDKRAIDFLFAHYHQMIITNDWPVSEMTAVRLAALHCHTLFGNFDPARHTAGFLGRMSPAQYLPSRLASIHRGDYWEKRVFASFAQHPPMSRSMATLMYLLEVSRTAYHGLGMFKATDLQIQGNPCHLAMGVDGFGIVDLELSKGYYWCPWSAVSEFGGEDSTLHILAEATNAPRSAFDMKLDNPLALRAVLESHRTLTTPSEEPIAPAPGRNFGLVSATTSEVAKALYINASIQMSIPRVFKDFLRFMDLATDNGTDFTRVVAEDVCLTGAQIRCVAKSLLTAYSYPVDPETPVMYQDILYQGGVGTPSSPFVPARREPLRQDIAIKEVRLVANFLDDKGLAALCELLAMKELVSGLETLTISCNFISNAGMLKLSQAIGLLPRLKSIDFGNTDLGNKGIMQLIKALKESECPLEALKLSSNRINRPDALEQLGRYVLDTPSLRVLEIANTHGLNAKGFKGFATAFAPTEEGARTCGLSELDLSQADLRKGDEYLHAILPAMPRLRVLRVGATGLQSVPELCKIVRTHVTSETFELLELSKLKLGDQGIAEVVSALLDGPSPLALEKLVLSENQYTGSNAAEIAGVLGAVERPTLRSLDLLHNTIGPRRDDVMAALGALPSLNVAL